jgi:exo-1,4-beta-D-glucosaminidase
MLNNAWPSTIWHLYDYYLQPAGGYFGAKNANEPVHIMFSYDDRGVVVVSDLPQAIHGAKATAEVFDEGLRSRSSQSAMVDVDADSVKSLFTIPEVADSRMHFLRLDLRDASGNVLSRNFYWLPKEKPTFDWSKSTFYYTPSPSYEDLKGLSQLPPASLEVSAKARADSGKTLITVVVKNSSNGLAFRTALRAFQTVNGDDVLPILWDDNYFDLLPGESRTISATVKPTTQPIAIDVAGWNSPSQIIPITVDTKGLSAKHP